MPSVTNATGDDLNCPGLGGLVVPAHATVEVSEEQAAELEGHPLLIVSEAEPARPLIAEPAKPSASEE